MSIKDGNKLLYYLNLYINQNLSRNDLRSKIKDKEYERLPKNIKCKLINKEETNIIDYVKNHIIVKNNNYEVISEKSYKS